MRLTATGGDGFAAIDEAEVARALGLLIEPGATFELRGLPSGRSRLCRTVEDGLRAAASLADDKGAYYTLHPLRSDLEKAACEGDVLSRRWVPIDVDPIRPKDTNATDAEKEAARSVADRVLSYLTDDRGWPMPLLIDSGNGFHLLFRCDLPADKLAKLWTKRFLHRLAEQFDTDFASIDLTVHNHSRIFKLPGTWARKGPASPDRPHRLCRILYSPEVLDTLPAESLKAEQEDGPEEKRDTVSRLKLKAIGDSLSAYVKRALDGETCKVLLAQPGNRHNTLRDAAYAVSGYLHTGAITEFEIRRSLRPAGLQCGLPEREVDDLIESGIEKGKTEPRAVPESIIGRNGKANPEPPPAGVRLIIRASEIPPRRVEWLWPKRIPIGKMTTFAGMGGLGKTFTLCDIAARVSTGRDWPSAGGECGIPGDVLFISGEDDEDDTLVPRLMECGADLRRVAFLTAECHDNFTLAALDLLTSVLDQLNGVRFVAIDPPTSYLDGIDDHRNAELRSVLTPLKRWAAKSRVALVLNTHVNKGGPNVEAQARVMGSVAWINAVRTAHMFVPDPDDNDKILFIPIKCNVGKKPKGLAYKIVDTHDDLAKIEWLGEVDTTADEALRKEKKKPRVMSASEWLVGLFKQQLEWPSALFWASAKENGISKYAIDEAKVKLSVPKARRTVGTDGDVTYTWWVPPDWPPLFADAKTGSDDMDQRSANSDETPF